MMQECVTDVTQMLGRSGIAQIVQSAIGQPNDVTRGAAPLMIPDLGSFRDDVVQRTSGRDLNPADFDLLRHVTPPLQRLRYKVASLVVYA